jgi:hypothetical protein
MKSLLDMSVKSSAKSPAVFGSFFSQKVYFVLELTSNILQLQERVRNSALNSSSHYFFTWFVLFRSPRARFTGARQIEDPIGFYASAWPNTNPQEVCTLQYDPLKAYEHTTIVFLLTLNF